MYNRRLSSKQVRLLRQIIQSIRKHIRRYNWMHYASRFYAISRSNRCVERDSQIDDLYLGKGNAIKSFAGVYRNGCVFPPHETEVFEYI